MKRNEDIIGQDFQGWPIYKMSLREILEHLGFSKISNRSVDYWQISDNDPILDTYPQTLEDDGMGYGVNEKNIIEVSHPNDEKLFLFIDSVDQEAIDKIKKEK